MMHLCGDIKSIYAVGDNDIVISRVVTGRDHYHLLSRDILYSKIPEFKDYCRRFDLPRYPKVIAEDELGLVYRLNLSFSLEKGMRVLVNKASFVDSFCALGCTTRDLFDIIGYETISYNECYSVVRLTGFWETLDKFGIVVGSEICFVDGKAEDYEFHDKYFLYNFENRKYIAWVRRQGIHMYIESSLYF